MRGLSSCVLNVCAAAVVLAASLVPARHFADAYTMMALVIFVAAPLLAAALIAGVIAVFQPRTRRDLLVLAWVLLLAHGGFWCWLLDDRAPFKGRPPPARVMQTTTPPGTLHG